MAIAMAAKRVSLASLTAAEPRLETVIREARNTDPGRWRNRWVAYEHYKKRLSALVGWGAESEDPRLHTPTAYEVAIQALDDALTHAFSCREQA